MMIDAHVHIFPDVLAPRALGALAANADKTPFTDGTAAGTLAEMDKHGIDKCVLQNIATKPGQDIKINDFALATAADKRFAGRFAPMGSVHPFSECWKSELARISDGGLAGIKLHPEYQRFEVLDERAMRVYEEAERLGLVVVFHAGFDPAFPDSRNADPARLAVVADTFPRLRCVFAHLGGFYRWEAVLKTLAGKDCYFDTAMCGGELDIELGARIVAKHGAERILFATDCPWGDWDINIQWVKALGLGAADEEKVFSGNARELFGI